MEQHKLIGTWSSIIRFGPGAMADEILAFFPDHHGILKVCNPAMKHIESFTWRVNEDDTLKISATTSQYFEYDQPEENYTSPGRLEFDCLQFQINKEITPRGEEMLVLTMDEHGSIWETALFDVQGRISQKFGFRDGVEKWRGR